MGDGDENCERLTSEIAKLKELYQHDIYARDYGDILEKKIECMNEIFS